MVSAFAGIMLGANYPIGAIFILIPWLFTNAGFPVATITVVFIVILYILLGHMMLESMSRAECLTRLQEEKEINAIKEDALIDHEIIPEISEKRSFWFVDITALFLPKVFTILITINTMIWLQLWIMMAGSTWGVGMTAYIPLFETCSMYDDPDGCWDRYAFYVGIFVLWGISSTLFGFASSTVIQHINTVFRVTAMSIIVGTSILSISTGVPIYEAPPSNIDPSTMDQFMLAISILLDMICLLLSQPMIVSQMTKRDAPTMKMVITTGIVLLGFVVLLIGYTSGYALKSPNIPEVWSIAWIGYSFDGETQGPAEWIIEKAMVLLPTWITLFNGTLFATTLTSSYHAMWPKVPKWVYWFLVWIVPLVGTLFIHKYSMIVTMASIALFYIVIINTSLVQIYSRRKVPIKSVYEGIHSSESVAYTTLVIGILLIGGPVWNLIYQPFVQP